MQARAWWILLLCSACMPAPVKAVDAWLEAYAAGDAVAQLRLTHPLDRPLLERALAARASAPTSTLAMALPPQPVGHALLEVVDKAPARWVVGTRLTLRNPLPSISEKVGQRLPGIPETRPLRRSFLVLEEGGRWTVRLDLERVVARAELAGRLLGWIADGRLAEAEAALAAGFPPPPDDGDGQTAGDRLRSELEERIRVARARTTTAVQTSTTIQAP